MRKTKKAEEAVSDIVGTVMLLVMAIALFSVLSAIVLSYPIDPPPPSANLIGYVDGNEIVMEHRGGERISLDTKIVIKIDNINSYEAIAEDYLNATTSNGDTYWNIGEIIDIYSPNELIFDDIIDATVHVSVIDVDQNYLLLSGYLQEAK